MIKYITIIILLFLSSCRHIIKIEGNKRVCWGAFHRSNECGVVINYNSKTQLYKIQAEDNWIMYKKADELTWK